MEGEADDAISLAELAERGDGRDAARVGGALPLRHPRRHLHLHLHVGDDRAAEGLRDQPRQLPRDARHDPARPPVLEAGQIAYLFLPLAHSFALLIQLGSFDIGGDDRLLGARPAEDRPQPGRGQAALLPVGAADLREDLHDRDRRGRQAGRAQEADLLVGDRRSARKVREMERAGRKPGFLLQQAVRVRRQAGAVEDPRPVRRPDHAVRDRRRADQPGDPALLRRRRRARSSRATG